VKKEYGLAVELSMCRAYRGAAGDDITGYKSVRELISKFKNSYY
jgi:hypothetical protein